VFIGHYGVALASKQIAPRLSLGALFFAVQLLDVLFSLFVLVGIENMRIVHGFTAYNPYDLYWMPYTHSLLGAAGWSVLAAFAWWAARRRLASPERRLEAAVLGAAVFSHFLLDVPVHTPDLPLGFGAGSPKIGLGLWNHPLASVCAELAIFLAGWVIYLRASRPTSRGFAVATAVFGVVLVALLLATPFQPDPASGRAFAIRALLVYSILAAAAGLIDRGRRMEGKAS
jgi:membrane-bound metal-dependent hydrolase YbcI (DUF457 family)